VLGSRIDTPRASHAIHKAVRYATASPSDFGRLHNINQPQDHLSLARYPA
jgi:hypothetical protein